MRRRSVEDWRRTVYRAPGVSGAVQVYLLYLAEHMGADRRVSRPRRLVARDLRVAERTVDYRNGRAVELGFLTVVTAGRKHVTAVYAATFPDSQRATSYRAENYETLRVETPGVPLSARKTLRTSTTADLSERGDRRDEERSYGEVTRAEATDLTDCEFHPWQTCPADCRNSRRTA